MKSKGDFRNGMNSDEAYPPEKTSARDQSAGDAALRISLAVTMRSAVTATAML
jgi:hypothetical protein